MLLLRAAADTLPLLPLPMLLLMPRR